jgi:hypothetical protein
MYRSLSNIDISGLLSIGAAEEAAPIPGALVNSLRAFGYALDTAIADLIDNSITAHAKQVDIRFDWNNGAPRISLVDDGDGMNENELVAALRLGVVNPAGERDANDLGRFGLGLKTASFSQARRLVVASKTKNFPLVSRCWDIDFIEESQKWQLLFGQGFLKPDEVDRMQSMEHGTMVLLENIDRMFSGGASNERKQVEFFARADQLASHLGEVFHRFLTGTNKLEIWINPEVTGAVPVVPWDPFLAHMEKTQIFQDEYLRVNGDTVHVKPYVLPHQSAFKTASEHKRAGGLKGWNAQQGFYVYRNDRLLVSGSWLNLGIRQEEHYKLARIALDISNRLDDVWEIDVRKSQAVPPVTIRADLKRIANRIRKQAKEVYGHRGKIINKPLKRKLTQLWEARKKDEKVSYRLNREYPLLQDIREQLNKKGKDALAKLLVLMEETIPVDKIYFNAVETPECHMLAFEGGRDQELIETARVLIGSYQDRHGYDYEEALDLLMALEPFDRHPYLRETLSETE